MLSVYGGWSGEDVQNDVGICGFEHPRAGSGDCTKVTIRLPRCLSHTMGVLTSDVKLLILSIFQFLRIKKVHTQCLREKEGKHVLSNS